MRQIQEPSHVQALPTVRVEPGPPAPVAREQARPQTRVRRTGRTVCHGARPYHNRTDTLKGFIPETSCGQRRRASAILAETPMRTLAVDYGRRRIGVAVSDALGLTSRGVTTLRNMSDVSAVARLAELARELEAEAIVVGLPVRADGSEGDAAGRVRRFLDQLEAAVDLPVHTVGEWLTSVEAEERLRAAGLSPAERKRRLDETAAVVILEEFLAARERSARRSGDG